MTDKEARKLIAIVEDDPGVARIIEQVLKDFGFDSAWCKSASELLRRLRTLAPDLCIVDLGLPDMDGLDVMKRIHEQSTCGILILTGRAHVSDRVMCLELGADDYVTKPFEPRELIARIRSILRRKASAAAVEAQARRVATFSGWQFNLANNTLRSPEGEKALLGTAEAELLKAFLTHPNRIMQREQLLGTRDVSATDRAIDVRVSRLRKRLEPTETSPSLIKTVYGAGYLFMAAVAWSDFEDRPIS